VQGLVQGVLEGNRMVRDNRDAHLDTIAKAFKWTRDGARDNLAKVHLSNLPRTWRSSPAPSTRPAASAASTSRRCSPTAPI